MFEIILFVLIFESASQRLNNSAHNRIAWNDRKHQENEKHTVESRKFFDVGSVCNLLNPFKTWRDDTVPDNW